MEGEGEPVLRHRLVARFEQHLLGDDALLAHAGEDRVTRLPRRLGMPVRAQPFRRARQCDQQCRLAGRQMPRLLAEIGQARRPHAFEIAAKRRQGEIKAENSVLREMPFQ